MGDNGWRFLLAADDDGGCSPPPTCRKCSSLQWDFPHFPSFTLSPLCLMDFHVDSKGDKMRSQNIEVLCHMKAGRGPVSPFAAFGINMEKNRKGHRNYTVACLRGARPGEEGARVAAENGRAFAVVARDQEEGAPSVADDDREAESAVLDRGQGRRS
ncbi:hypothetical protein EJB05_48056, partial [Eragrostis curvula]